MKRTWKLHTVRQSGVQPGTFLLSGDSVNHCTTVSQYTICAIMHCVLSCHYVVQCTQIILGVLYCNLVWFINYVLLAVHCAYADNKALLNFWILSMTTDVLFGGIFCLRKVLHTTTQYFNRIQVRILTWSCRHFFLSSYFGSKEPYILVFLSIDHDNFLYVALRNSSPGFSRTSIRKKKTLSETLSVMCWPLQSLDVNIILSENGTKGSQHPKKSFGKSFKQSGELFLKIAKEITKSLPIKVQAIVKNNSDRSNIDSSVRIIRTLFVL